MTHSLSENKKSLFGINGPSRTHKNYLEKDNYPILFLLGTLSLPYVSCMMMDDTILRLFQQYINYIRTMGG